MDAAIALMTDIFVGNGLELSPNEARCNLLHVLSKEACDACALNACNAVFRLPLVDNTREGTSFRARGVSLHSGFTECRLKEDDEALLSGYAPMLSKNVCA